MEEVELAPLRPLDDFLLSSARFQVPVYQDPHRWTNRVVNNLIYYQTNYFLLTVLVFLLVGLLHPVHMVVGVLSVAVVFCIFVYITENKMATKRFKRDHPTLCVLLVLLGGYGIVSVAGTVMVFLFGIALPMLLTFIHASLRMRNMKNKVANKIDFIGLKRTPMGLLLEALGQEQEAGS